MVQICRLENIGHKNMKQVSYSGKYFFSASIAHQSHLQFSFVVGDVFCQCFLHVDVWRGVWRCTHAKLAPLTPHPLAWDRHYEPASGQRGERFGAGFHIYSTSIRKSADEFGSLRYWARWTSNCSGWKETKRIQPLHNGNLCQHIQCSFCQTGRRRIQTNVHEYRRSRCTWQSNRK